MDELTYVSVPEAAERLGVDPSFVRALAARDSLEAKKIGGRWLVASSGVDERLRAKAWPGRPFSPRNALALLFLVSGENAMWVRPDVRSRLRRAGRSLPSLVGRLARRARSHRYRGSEFAIKRLRDDPDFVLSGVSAAAKYAFDVAAPQVLEGYYPERKLADICYRFALDEVLAAEANLIIHSVETLPFKRRIMPPAVVALDLIESFDERSRRAGIRFVNSVTRA